MPKTRHYEVLHAFAARHKETKERVWIGPAKAGQLEDLLSPKKIALQIAAGNVKDNGPVVEETAAEDDEDEQPTTTSRSPRGRTTRES